MILSILVSSRLVKGVLQELKDQDLIHLIPTGSLIYRFELPENQPTASAEEDKTENVPDVLSIVHDLDADDNDSDESQSLLSLSGHIDPWPFNDSIEEEDADDLDFNSGCSKMALKDKAVLGKRKPGELSEADWY